MELKQENIKALELKLLYEITRAIRSNPDLVSMLSQIYRILYRDLGIDDICVWVRDPEENTFNQVYNSNNLLKKDFIADLNLDGNLKKEYIEEQLLFITMDNKLISIDKIDKEELKKVPSTIKLLLPVFDRGELSGIVGFFDTKAARQLVLENYLMLLTIVATQISTAIVNEKLYKQVVNIVEVSESTKEIAKIIETQYELQYVLPLMGEIMDKYLRNALVYIFVANDNGKMEISWPASYNYNVIDPLLDEMRREGGIVFTADSQAIAIPIIIRAHLFGAIVADAKVTEIEDNEAELLKEFAKQCNITIQRALAYAETVKYATIDALTGLDNRRQLDKRLLQESSIVMRTHRPFSLLMMDIDHFKKINDTHGHSVGDYVLKGVANIVKATIREYDIAGRYGGEEFAIIMPDANQEGALILAERLRKRVEETQFNVSKFASSKAETISITLSIGIATYNATDKNPADIYEEADIALYKAKQEGRNRVVTFSTC